MKHCGKCNIDFEDHLNFCTQCGNPVTHKEVSVDTENNLEYTGNSSKDIGNSVNPKSKIKLSIRKIIKRTLIVIVLLVVGLTIWGVHLINSTTYLNFNSQGEIFSKSGGCSEVNIDYDGYVWEVNYKPSWIDIDERDNCITINCQPNMGGQDREDHITIKSGKIVQALPVAQYGQARYIRLSEYAVSSDTEGGSIRINVETDGSGFDILYPNFCSICDHDLNGFTLVVNENDEFTRSGILYVKEDEISASIAINQKGKCRDCDGKGKTTCLACWGQGTTGFGMYMMQCFTCGGSGKQRCGMCGATGFR